MLNPDLPPDDLPPQQPEQSDRRLRRQLNQSLRQRFQQQCDPKLLEILANCDWSILATANVVTLVIICRDRPSNWQVLNQLTALGERMARFSQAAKLRIYPTPAPCAPLEVRVDELAIYQESP